MDLSKFKLDLTNDEGYKTKPYKDTTGHLTIGVGRNLTAKGLSPACIELCLDEDIEETCEYLDRFLPWWRRETEPRQRVLANMCFNLGIKGLLGFTNMLAAIEAQDYTRASKEMLNSRWAKQVGDRAVRLATAMKLG